MGTAWLVCLAGRNTFHVLQKDRELVSNFVCFSAKVGRERQICKSCGDPMAMRVLNKITGNSCGKEREREELAVSTHLKL